MLDINPDTLEALEESLYDLKHDLGKYVRLPVSMLPKDAPWETVAEQAVRAVEETRKGPDGPIAAHTLFDRFAAEWEETLGPLALYKAVRDAVAETAVLVRRIRDKDGDLTRETVDKVLGGVSKAIERLMNEVLYG